MQQLEEDVRARVASGNADADLIEKARQDFEEWLVSDLDFVGAKVYTAEEVDLRRALKMEA